MRALLFGVLGWVLVFISFKFFGLWALAAWIAALTWAIFGEVNGTLRDMNDYDDRWAG